MISSSSAQRGSPFAAHYAASKGGVLTLTKSLAREYALAGHHVNNIPPSGIETPMQHRARPRASPLQRADRQQHSGRATLGTGADIAAAVGFLCSEEAGFITGQTLASTGVPCCDPHNVREGGNHDTMAEAGRGQLDRALPGSGHRPDLVPRLHIPEFYELEREAIFKRAWLNVARIEDLPSVGSYLTKEIEAANASIIVVKGPTSRSAHSTTSAATAETSWCGTTFPPGRPG